MAFFVFKNMKQRQYKHTTYSKKHVPIEALEKYYNYRLFFLKDDSAKMKFLLKYSDIQK